MLGVLDVFAAIMLATAVLLAVAVTWVVAVRRRRPPAHTRVSTSATLIGRGLRHCGGGGGRLRRKHWGWDSALPHRAIAAFAVGLTVLAWWPRGAPNQDPTRSPQGHPTHSSNGGQGD